MDGNPFYGRLQVGLFAYQIGIIKMIKAHSLLDYLKKKRCYFYSGVPCSLLKEILEAAYNDREVSYLPAVREDAALGVASGAYLAGNKSCIFIQNSGLGNIVNGLTSFNLIYKIPVLMFITWRGFKGMDAPEHIIMGKKMMPLLKELGIPSRVLSDGYKKDIDWALGEMETTKMPAALIVREGIVV